MITLVAEIATEDSDKFNAQASRKVCLRPHISLISAYQATSERMDARSCKGCWRVSREIAGTV